MASIRKRTWKTSKNEVRTAWAVDFVTAAGDRDRRQFATRREADAFRVEIEGQLRAGTFRPDSAKVTVKDVATEYLEHVKGRSARREKFSAHHLKTVEGHVGNYISPDRAKNADDKRRKRVTPFQDGIGHMKLGQVTARAVSDFRDRIRTAGVSVPTARKILGTLHSILAYAIGRDYIAANAAAGVEVIGTREQGSKRITPPTKDDLKSLLDVASEDFRVLLTFAAATGLRAGELHALRWRHMDLASNSAPEVTVETRVDAYGDEDVTKTAAGMRTVPLGADTINTLRRWKLRSKWAKPEDLVFPNRRGTFQDHSAMVKRKFLPLFAKANAKRAEDGLPPIRRFNWHALRHFAISCWIEADLKPKTVQTFAGHSSLSITMDRYGHLFPSDDHRKAMDRIGEGLFK